MTVPSNTPLGLPGVSSPPGKTLKPLTYKSFLKAPESHKDIMRAYVARLFPDAQICYSHRISAEEFQQIINHPPNVEYLVKMASVAMREQMKIFNWHDKHAGKFLQVFADVAFDKKQKGADRVSAAKTALSLHPSTQFSPHTRSSVKIEDESKDAVNVLRQRYLEDKQREERQSGSIPVTGESDS
jgi:aromatic ring-cleaving dioxygenase